MVELAGGGFFDVFDRLGKIAKTRLKAVNGCGPFFTLKSGESSGELTDVRFAKEFFSLSKKGGLTFGAFKIFHPLLPAGDSGDHETMAVHDGVGEDLDARIAAHPSHFLAEDVFGLCVE